MTLYVEYPYDRGFPHMLRGVTESAVISAEAAQELIAQGVKDEAPGAEPPPDLYVTAKLSRKARRMLGINTMSLFP